jgi:hypothetical protein
MIVSDKLKRTCTEVVLHPAFEDGPNRGSETSAKLNLTPGKYPKENIQVSEHGENLKSSGSFFPPLVCWFGENHNFDH